MRRSLITTLLITAACLVMSTGCQRAASAAREETDLIPIQVRTPAVVERQDSVTASGSVEGSETTDVAFQVSGKVARVFVEEGQHVSRGQLLAELEPTDYRNAFDAANAQKQVAEALAQKAAAGLRKQEVEEARIDLNRWEDEYKRMRFLVERKSLPPNDFQKIEAAYNAARERYQMAVEGTRLEDRNAAMAQALAAKAQASEESKRLGDTRLLAPITGNISMRRIDPGQTVAAGAPVLFDRQPQSRQGARRCSRSGDRKGEAGRQGGGFAALARRTVFRRSGRNHRSVRGSGFAHVRSEDRRAQPWSGAAGWHGGRSPDLSARRKNGC